VFAVYTEGVKLPPTLIVPVLAVTVPVTKLPTTLIVPPPVKAIEFLLAFASIAMLPEAFNVPVPIVTTASRLSFPELLLDNVAQLREPAPTLRLLFTFAEEDGVMVTPPSTEITFVAPIVMLVLLEVAIIAREPMALAGETSNVTLVLF
jgi:hypothetical protein